MCDFCKTRLLLISDFFQSFTLNGEIKVVCFRDKCLNQMCDLLDKGI